MGSLEEILYLHTGGNQQTLSNRFSMKSSPTTLTFMRIDHSLQKS